MRVVMLCLALAACAAPRSIDVLWTKEPGAATTGSTDGKLCHIVTADRGEVDAAEFGKAFRRCLNDRGL